MEAGRRGAVQHLTQPSAPHKRAYIVSTSICFLFQIKSILGQRYALRFTTLASPAFGHGLFCGWLQLWLGRPSSMLGDG